MTGRVKSREIKRHKPENKSIKLRTSPVKMNKPFRRRSPAQKSTNWTGITSPNTIERNTTDEIKSIKPNILTNTMKSARNGINKNYGEWKIEF